MRIPDEIRKCVVFVGYQMADGSHRLAGSAFFLGREVSGQVRAEPVYLVTAKHLVKRIANLGLEQVWIRLNLADGDAIWVPTLLADWFIHPTDSTIDVAILKCGIPNEYDHLVYPISRCIRESIIRENEIDLGEEVIIVGLFRHRHGNHRNIPIVRVGNLASHGEEQIETQMGEMDAHLIEARSIGGLSGSPVFLNLGDVRVIKNQLKIASGQTHFLFGLIHGHFDVKTPGFDHALDDEGDGLSVSRVNTGIAIAVPCSKIENVILEKRAR